MAKDSDPLAGAFDTRESGGILSGLLAEENEFDRRTMWRLGSWGVAAVGAIVVAVMANQAQLGWRRDQVASADLARQAERLAVLTRESQNEARRLTAAIETLNTDRDRLYTRVTVLEQGLDSVTGAIAKQAAAPAQPAPTKPEPSSAPAPQAAAPAVAPVASTPASDKPAKEAANKEAANKEAAKEHASPQQTAAPSASMPAASELPAIPLVAAKSMMAPPDPAASKLMQPEMSAKPKDQSQPTDVAAAPPSAEPEAATESEAPAITVQQTRFAVDLGSANSVPGLRALWRGLTKSNPDLAKLRPIIMVKESKTGLGMQLRLGAGPLVNAAAAAKICAALSETDRSCETAVFDGQRLSMQGQEKGQDKGQEKVQDASPQAETPAASAAKPEKPHRRSYSSKRSKREEPPPPPAAAPAKPETTSTLSSFFSRR
ncbi:hypothetical protein JQ596_29205 [Bradyrhizobium manausense]|uniref:hypothetical protein n=1 Tax=Bradyrhizobium TaxID=374 RepID=UPI001BAB45BB|nr:MULTISPECIES: hypothetical protein [Bradyrhizobium]MBR0829617.1 hypothetical protein [Bradyrhizobium manausense]UVO25240.1 hypothetical protein KUF59_21740 [Bradyrhizobium arachidis]